MKNYKSLLFMTVSSLFFMNSLAWSNEKIEIACTHSQICLATEEILKSHELKKDIHYSIKQTIKIAGDPHDFEPKASEIKELIRSPLLISGPLELNPWIKKIIPKRTNNPKLKTISLEIGNTDDLYSSKNKEALAHFWLYPMIQCELEAQLEAKLVALNLIQEKMNIRNACMDEATLIEKELMAEIKKIKLPVVFTHDALIPFFNMAKTTNQNFMAIKGSGHHHETTAASIKTLHDALKAPKVIWVIEKNINVPKNILNKKRANDLVLNIETADPVTTKRFSNLHDLKEKIKAINE